METINISANVTEIAQSVFIGCKKLMTVNFAGTVEQWDAAKEDTTGMVFGMTIDGECHETCSIVGDYGDFTVCCTDGEVSGKTYTADSDFDIG